MMDVVGNRSPLLFPLYVESDLWWYRGDRARHHYGTRVLSIRDLPRQERAPKTMRDAASTRAYSATLRQP